MKKTTIDSPDDFFAPSLDPSRYTWLSLQMYMVVLACLLTISCVHSFLFSNKNYSKIDKVQENIRSWYCITISKDFSEYEVVGNPEEIHDQYILHFQRVHLEFASKLVLHTMTNILLTLPWNRAYHAARERHQILTTIGQCYGVEGTLEVEKMSLQFLWMGCCLLPMIMTGAGVLNYLAFRLYIKLGHPWKNLLLSDHERVKTWRTLKFWKFVEKAEPSTESVDLGTQPKKNYY